MKNLITLILFFFTTVIVAQEIEIIGQIKDDQEMELPFASVVFKSTTDSLKLHGTLGDDSGKFTFKVPKDRYAVEVSFVGMKPNYFELDLSAEEGVYDMGVIKVSTDILLDEVVVTGNKKAFKVDVDKKVYDVSQDIVARGGSLADVMLNLPSVQVESDGQVSIRGDQNVRILIDGKPSGLASSAELFSSIPASSIEKVEIITNPSSKYSAQGTAGIINVILKKGQKKRLNSSVEVFTGYRFTAGVNGNITQSGESGSWYANGGLGYSEPKAINDIFLRNPNSTSNLSTQNSNREREQYYYLLNLGGTKSFNENTSLSGSMTYRGAQSDNINTTIYDDFDNETLLRQSNREDNEDETNNYVYGNISLDHKFNESHQLSFNVSGELTKGDEDGNISSSEIFPSSSTLNQDFTKNSEEIQRYVLSADYNLQLKNDYKIELGYRSDLSSIENEFSVERESQGMSFIIPDFTDNTSYEENVHAFYGQVSKKAGDLSIKLGLRSEISDIDIISDNNNSLSQKNYTNWFPSAFLSYTLDDNNKLQLSASRRINRPSSWMIIPFSSFSDERNIFEGNPDIDPSYRVAVELSYTARFSEEFNFFPTFYYRKTTDEMEFFVEKQQLTIGNISQEIFSSMVVNIGEYNAYGAELGASYSPFKWWDMYTEIGLNGFRQRGSFKDASFDGDGLLVSGRYNVTFNLTKSIKFQIQNFYRGPIETGQYRRRGFYGMNMGLSSKVFNGKGSLSFNVRDVFNSNKRLVTTFDDDFLRDIEIQYRVRQMTLSLTYYFNQKKYSGKKGNQFDNFKIIN